VSADPAVAIPRRVPKPWGEELIWALTDRYCGKVITIETGRRLSLQYHEYKDEAIYVTRGRLRLLLENDRGQDEVRELGPGEGAHVPVGRRHRYEAIERVSSSRSRPPSSTTSSKSRTTSDGRGPRLRKAAQRSDEVPLT